MNIYVGHSKLQNYREDLYKPLRESELNQEHTFIFPHEESDRPYNSKEYLFSTCDLLIADVTHLSLGLGVELGWADSFGVPIICLYKRGTTLSKSLAVITKYFIVYDNPQDMIQKLKKVLPQIEGKDTK